MVYYYLQEEKNKRSSVLFAVRSTFAHNSFHFHTCAQYVKEKPSFVLCLWERESDSVPEHLLSYPFRTGTFSGFCTCAAKEMNPMKIISPYGLKSKWEYVDLKLSIASHRFCTYRIVPTREPAGFAFGLGANSLAAFAGGGLPKAAKTKI